MRVKEDTEQRCGLRGFGCKRGVQVDAGPAVAAWRGRDTVDEGAYEGADDGHCLWIGAKVC
jgi:hypothetical protein